jgi:Tol biopolymer transport system component
MTMHAEPMLRTLRRLTWILLATALVLWAADLAAQSGHHLFQKALAKERAEGQLDAAIQLYEQVVREFGTDRPLAAKALLQIGRCYERLGKDGAQKAYDRLVRDYGDQPTLAEEARARLAALAPAATRRPGPTARQVWGYSGETDMSGTVSSDGRYLSFTDWNSGDLAIRDLTAGVNRRVTHKGSWEVSYEHVEASAMSHDGKRIAYNWVHADGSVELRLIAASGGEPHVRYKNTDLSYLQPFEWSPDGHYILLVLTRKDRTNQIAMLPVDQGPIRVLKTFDWRSPNHAGFSPDGRYIVYDLPASSEVPERDLFVLAVDGSREARIVSHPAHDFLLGGAPGSDRVLFASDRSGATAAWTIRVENGTPRGQAVLAKPSIGHVLPINFSRNGDYYYALSTGVRSVYLTEWDAAGGTATPLAPLKGRFEEGKGAAVWSPDGTDLAYLLQSPLVRGGEGGNTIAIRALATGHIRTIPVGMSYIARIRWMPDRAAVILQGTDLKGRRGLFRVSLTAGDIEPIVVGPISRFAIAPDSRTLFYLREKSVVRRDLQTGAEADIHSVPQGSGLALSPDGRWLALKVNLPADHGRPSIQILPVEGGEPRTLHTLPDVDSSTWRQLAWSADGRTVLFTNHHREVWQIPATGGTPRRLFGGLTMISEISIHPDGRRMAVSAGNAKYEMWVMENLLSAAPPSSFPSAKPRGAARK